MRPSLLHPLADRRQRAPRRALRLARLMHEPPPSEHVSTPKDATARRVREAGGPLDEAHYSCACGYLFVASVSTSVSCPHCGATQAW
jgi:hypothetical protein